LVFAAVAAAGVTALVTLTAEGAGDATAPINGVTIPAGG
jgi:hypothetical protein